jgi:hypothetical protein
MTRNSGASLGKSVKVDRMVDRDGRGRIESGGRVERRVSSRAIVTGTLYCSRRRIVGNLANLVLFDLDRPCDCCWRSEGKVRVTRKNNVGGCGVK